MEGFLYAFLERRRFFQYYHLGESIISVDKDGYGDFNWSLGHDFIEKSLLAHTTLFLMKVLPVLLQQSKILPSWVYNVNNYTMAGVVSLSSPEENYGALDNEYISELIASSENKNLINNHFY